LSFTDELFLSNVNSLLCPRPSDCRLSVTFVRPTQAIKICSAIFLRHLVRWPSVDIQVKFYIYRPRGTLPSGVRH